MPVIINKISQGQSTLAFQIFEYQGKAVGCQHQKPQKNIHVKKNVYIPCNLCALNGQLKFGHVHMGCSLCLNHVYSKHKAIESFHLQGALMKPL